MNFIHKKNCATFTLFNSTEDRNTLFSGRVTSFQPVTSDSPVYHYTDSVSQQTHLSERLSLQQLLLYHRKVTHPASPPTCPISPNCCQHLNMNLLMMQTCPFMILHFCDLPICMDMKYYFQETKPTNTHRFVSHENNHNGTEKFKALTWSQCTENCWSAEFN